MNEDLLQLSEAMKPEDVNTEDGRNMSRFFLGGHTMVLLIAACALAMLLYFRVCMFRRGTKRNSSTFMINYSFDFPNKRSFSIYCQALILEVIIWNASNGIVLELPRPSSWLLAK